MTHPVNRRQMPGWKQARRLPAPAKLQGGFAKRAPGRKISPPAKPR
jgi:hypothetical protein